MIQNWRNSDTPPCTAGSLLCKNNRTAAAEGGKWLFFFLKLMETEKGSPGGESFRYVMIVICQKFRAG